MIDLMMNAEQDVSQFLERMTGGPLDGLESDDVTLHAYFAIAGSQAAEMAPLAAR